MIFTILILVISVSALILNRIIKTTVAFHERGIYHRNWFKKLLNRTGEFRSWEEFKGYKTDGNWVILPPILAFEEISITDYEGTFGWIAGKVREIARKIEAVFEGKVDLRFPDKNGEVKFVVGQHLKYLG